MCSGRVLALAAAAAALLSSGCHSCPGHDRAEAQFALAEFNYQNQKFDQAKRIYMNALENCPELYPALVGLGNACREYGTDQYRLVDELIRQGKQDVAEKVFKEANENHGQAHKCFEEALKREPDDLLPRYGMALLWYQRTSSPWPYPYPEDDRRRAEERNRAIEEFARLVKEKPDLYQARRYLGLSLFVTGRMDEGREHLKEYHDYQQRWYNHVMTWPQQTPQQKEQKETALNQVENEINQCREILVNYFDALKREQERLKRKSSRSPEEEQRLAIYGTELNKGESMMRSLVMTRIGPAELEVWQRCQLYFTSINRGVLQDVLGFVFVKPGEDFVVRQKVAERLDRGARYEKLSHRSIAIAGDTATVGLDCERIASRGARPEKAELSLTFRLAGGQWAVADYDHP